MNNFYSPLFLYLCAIALAFPSCTLEKEPDIPTGANNIENLVFDTSAIIPDTNNNFQAMARLSSLGNLNILHHGWVWSETPEPTVEDDSLDLGPLNADSFSTQIAGLELEKLYYLRPFVINGCGVFYGTEDVCSFLGVNFTINTATEIYKGTEVRFTNLSVGNNTYLWEYGDGDTSTMYSPPPHTYDTTGILTVQLTAVNGCGTVIRTIVLDISDLFEDYWVAISGGTFMMGCTSEQVYCDPDNDEIPIHSVNIQSFLIGKTEITQGQWLTVMGNNPSIFLQCGQDCPVESVSWDDVQIFLDKLNADLSAGTKPFRLPTEAEWEYAARAGQSFRDAGADTIGLVGWYSGNADASTHAVQHKLPNGYGTYDMSGNVWEWVEDDFHEDYMGAPADGSAWIDEPRSGGRMYRGGSWEMGEVSCRNPNRGGDPTDTRRSRLGFRLARDQ